jgi:hypothetical protein
LAPLPGGKATKGKDSPRIVRSIRGDANAVWPCLRRHGRRGQNASGRWTGFFPTSIKNRPIQMSTIRLYRALEMSSPPAPRLARSLLPLLHLPRFTAAPHMLVEMRDDRPASQSARNFDDQAGGRGAGVAKRSRGCGPPV